MRSYCRYRVSFLFFFFSSRRRHTRLVSDWSSTCALPISEEKAPREEKQSFIITDDTEVRVDGRPCKYENLPQGAEVILVDVAKDKKTIRKIHFRSKK